MYAKCLIIPATALFVCTAFTGQKPPAVGKQATASIPVCSTGAACKLPSRQAVLRKQMGLTPPSAHQR